MTRVVVADDHPIFVRGLVDVLQKGGFEVVGEASDGAQALDVLRTLRPDLAVIDVGMPVLNGIGVLRAATKENLAKAYVMLSLHDERTIADTAISLGAGAYVLKDNAVDELIDAVHTALAGETWISPKLSGVAVDDTTLRALTPAELRVLAQLADNLTSPQIAQRLGLSVRTVQNHRAHVCEKLGLTGTHRLLQLALQNKDRIRTLVAAADAADDVSGEIAT